jgi:hypothetical protein
MTDLAPGVIEGEVAEEGCGCPVWEVADPQVQSMGGMSEVTSGGSLGGRIRRLTACSMPVVGDEVGAGRADHRCL